MARVAGWFLLLGLPISVLQVAEVGMHSPWTVIVDRWVTPVDEIIQAMVIGIALYAIYRGSADSGVAEGGGPPGTPFRETPGKEFRHARHR